MRRREVDEEKEKELEEQSRQKAPEEQVLAMCERLYERRKKPQPVRDIKAEKKSFKELEAFAKQQSTWRGPPLIKTFYDIIIYYIHYIYYTFIHSFISWFVSLLVYVGA